MFQGIRKIWKPGAYQGKARMQAYFEGWYYKLVNSTESEIVVIIPGISFGTSENNSHAFIQLLDNTRSASTYLEFNINEFWGSSKSSGIKIGQNDFSPDKISLNAGSREDSPNGTLSFKNIKPWPVTLLSPGAMGWYAFVPFMECYHAVLSFDHTIEGILNVNGRSIDFTGGKGYIEKDWGRSFPKYHLWLQTNHFDNPGTSLMVSIANIPWLGSYFDGFIAGFLHDNRLYRLTTYTGARLTLFNIDGDHLDIHISSDKYRIEIKITDQEGIALRAPELGKMTGRLRESQTASAFIRLFHIDKKQEELVFQGIGRNTGLEIAGHRDEIMSIQVH